MNDVNKDSLNPKDLHLINDLNAALQTEKHRGLFAVIVIFFILIIVFLLWAYFSTVEQVTRGQGSVIPTSREQIVQSLDHGTIAEMKVKEGDIVEKGQVLLKMDDTRSSAILRESEAKVVNLEAMIARLRAEAYGIDLTFDDNIPADLRRRERAAYQARLRALTDTVNGLQASKAMLDQEINITALWWHKVWFPKLSS